MLSLLKDTKTSIFNKAVDNQKSLSKHRYLSESVLFLQVLILACTIESYVLGISSTQLASQCSRENQQDRHKEYAFF